MTNTKLIIAGKSSAFMYEVGTAFIKTTKSKRYGGSGMSTEKYVPERMDDFFNRRVEGYEAHMKGLDNSDEFYNMVPYAIKQTDKAVKLLDLGCGTGLEIQGILEKAPNAQITCMDMAAGMLQELKKKYSAHSGQLNIITGSYLDLPFVQDEYDYVVAVQTMHHWQEDIKLPLYRKIWGALRPGGLYIEADYTVDEQEEQKMLGKYMELKSSGVLKEGEVYHIDIPFSVKTQKRLLGAAGFNRVDVVYEKGNGAVLGAAKDAR